MGQGSYGPSLPELAFAEVLVSSISADMYNCYQFSQRYNDTDGNPFAEPAPLRSNVPGGYGPSPPGPATQCCAFRFKYYWCRAPFAPESPA